MSRLDALVCRERNGKKYYSRIGVAFPTKNGGWSVKLDSLPIDGEMLLSPPLEPREGARASREPGDDSEPWA